jgi:hypothetical protein
MVLDEAFLVIHDDVFAERRDAAITSEFAAAIPVGAGIRRDLDEDNGIQDRDGLVGAANVATDRLR